MILIENILIGALICTLVAILAFVVSCLHSATSFSRYDRDHPPISDDEFMSRLPQGTNRDIALRVRTIVAEQLGIARDRIYPESTFIEMIE